MQTYSEFIKKPSGKVQQNHLFPSVSSSNFHTHDHINLVDLAKKLFICKSAITLRTRISQFSAYAVATMHSVASDAFTKSAGGINPPPTNFHQNPPHDLRKSASHQHRAKKQIIMQIRHLISIFSSENLFQSAGGIYLPTHQV